MPNNKSISMEEIFNKLMEDGHENVMKITEQLCGFEVFLKKDDQIYRNIFA